MSNVIIAGSYEIDRYVLDRPQISVPSSMLSGSFIAQSTQVNVKYVKGLFDGPDPMFAVDDEIEIYNDGAERLFNGYIAGVQTNRGVTVLTCNTKAHRALSAVVNFEATNTQPTTALASWLDSIGVEHRGLESITGLVCNILCPAASNIKGYDLISQVADMVTADVTIVDDVLVFYERDAAYDGYTVTGIMNYPEQSDDGTQRQSRGVSIRYVFDGQVPYTSGIQTENVWAPDFSNGSAFQLIGTTSAEIAGTLRLTRYANPHIVYSVKVRADCCPVLLGDWYQVNHGPMSGRYRLIGYNTDGKVYMMQMEAE